MLKCSCLHIPHQDREAAGFIAKTVSLQSMLDEGWVSGPEEWENSSGTEHGAEAAVVTL